MNILKKYWPETIPKFHVNIIFLPNIEIFFFQIHIYES